MDCSNYTKKIYLYVSGELSKKEQADFENHLARCAACRKELAIYRNLTQNYHSLPSVTGSEIVPEDILKHVRPRADLKRYFGSYLRFWVPAVAALLLVFAGLSVPHLLNRIGFRTDSQQPDLMVVFEPSSFELRRKKREASQLQIRFPKKEKIDYLAEEIANLRRPETSLTFNLSYYSRTQLIKKKIRALRNDEIFS